MSREGGFINSFNIMCRGRDGVSFVFTYMECRGREGDCVLFVLTLSIEGEMVYHLF